MSQDEFDFGGYTYEPEFDSDRLGKQCKVVFKLMADSEWRTLREIEIITRYPQASISARLRDFRKDKFGGHVVMRRRRGDPSDGLFEYCLIL